MKSFRYLISAGCGALVLSCAMLGCGAEEPEPVGEPVEITPAMEDMKQEMMKNFQDKSYGVKK